MYLYASDCNASLIEDQYAYVYATNCVCYNTYMYIRCVGGTLCTSVGMCLALARQFQIQIQMQMHLQF